MQVPQGEYRCWACDPTKLGETLLSAKRRDKIVGHLRDIEPDKQQVVLSRAPPELREALATAIAARKFCPGRPGDPCNFRLKQRPGPAQLRNGQKKCWVCGPKKDMAAELARANGVQRVATKLKRMGPAARAKALDERVPGRYRRRLEELCGVVQMTLLSAAATVGLGGARGRGGRAAAASARAGAPAEAEDREAAAMKLWSPVLDMRGVHWAPPDRNGECRWRAALLDSRRRVLNKFGIQAPRMLPGQDVTNADTGAPPATRSRLAADFQFWVKFNSWGVCETCGVLQMRPLTPEGMQRPLDPQISWKDCGNCNAKRSYTVVTPADAPEEMQGLDEAAALALALVEVDVGGPEQRHTDGYRKHTAMMRFLWHPRSADERVDALADASMRKKAKRALRYLKTTDGSAWVWFYKAHMEFLAKHKPDAEEHLRIRWSRFIEEEGVECAAWPTVFWDLSLCLTHERETNPHAKRFPRQSYENFQQGRPAPIDVYADYPEDADGLPGPELEDGRHSIKRLFAALAMAPDVSFVHAYELLHFAYDLHLWTTLGAKRNLKCSAPLRQMLSGESFSPLFWRRAHLALLDVVRQRGCPPLFLTIAPYDWSFPYHVALTDSMAKLRAPRQWFPVLETIHMSHVMVQAVWSLLCGAHKHKKPAGRENDYQIIPAVDEDGNKVDVFPVLRIEFQDGTKAEPTQNYHGSGRPHIHSLVWGVDVKQWKLHEWARATVPGEDEGVVRGYVLGAQLDKNNRTEWPVHEGQSCWDEEAGTYKLQHSADDKAQGVRAWVDVLLEGLNGSHQDLQFRLDDSNLAAYVAKYVPKFSDGMTNDFLDDDSGLSGDATAAGILARYRPLEPEMALQLLAQHMPQWRIGTETHGARDFLVPWPEQEDLSADVAAALAAYEKCQWRGEEMPLLEFLRKSDDGNKGNIVQWLVRKHHAEVERQGYEWYKTHLPPGKRPNVLKTWIEKVKKRQKDAGEAGKVSLQDYLARVENVEFTVPDLETFARKYETQGEKAVCCNMRSRLNDLFYGQWLVLNVPFRSRAELIPTTQLENVPREHRNLAMAVMSNNIIAKRMWYGWTDEGIEQEMRLEGHRQAYRESIHNYVRVHRQLIFDHVAGRVPEASASLGQIADGLIQPARLQVERVAFLHTQERFAALIPHEKDVEGRVRSGEAARVRAGDLLQLGAAKARVLSVRRFDDFRTMLQELGYWRAVPGAKSLSAALRVYHRLIKNCERRAAQHGVVAFELGPPDQAPRDPLDGPVRLQPQQARAVRLAEECIDRALRCNRAATEAERDAARAQAREGSRILVVDGPPGTGKSFVQHLLIRRTLENCGRVLYTFLTAHHADRARETFGEAVDIDTFHGALGDGSDPYYARNVLQMYALVMVDECFLLQEGLFHHLRNLYLAADKVPCILLAGDKHQMGSPGGRPCFFSPSWDRSTRTTTLKYDPEYTQRTSDVGFIKLLNQLRMGYPKERSGACSVTRIMWGKRAWPGNRPTVDCVRRLFNRVPHTTVLAISREAVHEFNELAVQAFHTNDEYLGTIHGDVESDPANYDENKELKPHRLLRPMELHLYKGMTVVITKNFEKPHFVNGTICVVEDYDARNGGVRLITTRGRRLVSAMRPDKDLGDIRYHPLRPGYCSTIIKLQGAELRHVTLWLDVVAPGAAYTGLSRVKTAEDYLIGGNVEAKHFMPACEGWKQRLGKRPHGQAFEPRPKRRRLR